MKKLSFLIITLFVINSAKLFAQSSFPVPENYSLKDKADYAKYEADIIKTVDWLQETPWAEQTVKRKQANTFLIAWLTGSPNISIDINEPVYNLTTKNHELLVTYMGAFAKYALQHKSDFDKVQANESALKSMIGKYNNDATKIKDSAMENLIKIEKDGNLISWIKQNLAKAN